MISSSKARSARRRRTRSRSTSCSRPDDLLLIDLVTLLPFVDLRSGGRAGDRSCGAILAALLVCLIPHDRRPCSRHRHRGDRSDRCSANVIATAAARSRLREMSTCCFSTRPGTITYGNRRAAAFHTLAGVEDADLVEAALLASLADETPEGRSIVDLAHELGCTTEEPADARLIPLPRRPRMSRRRRRHSQHPQIPGLIRISDFGLPSAFGPRVSDFSPKPVTPPPSPETPQSSPPAPSQFSPAPPWPPPA